MIDRRTFTPCAECESDAGCYWAKACMAVESTKMMDEATDPAATAPATTWPWKAPSQADEVQP